MGRKKCGRKGKKEKKNFGKMENKRINELLKKVLK
jgi:hypothetical protein